MFSYWKLMKEFIDDKYGVYRKTIYLAFADAMLQNVGIILIFVSFDMILQNKLVKNNVLNIFAVMVFVVIIRVWLKKYKSYMENEVACTVIERERLIIGDRFKNFPMKYFTKDKLGEFSSIVTNDLTFLAEQGIPLLNEIVNNFILQSITIILLSIFDYRLAFVCMVILIISYVYLYVLKGIIEKESLKKQTQHGIFTDSVLEYAMGIPVIKSFNVYKDKASRINKEIKNTKSICLGFENKFIPIILGFRLIIAIGVSVMIFFSLYFYKELDNKSYMIILSLYSIYVFLPASKLGDLISVRKISEACLIRYNNLLSIDTLDISEKPEIPKSYDIEFDNVSFSYNDKETLKDINFKIKEKNSLSLVGHSGSGKTTIANLILRFWDIKKGSIKIGSIDIRNMTSDILFSMVSVVFQDVYLFNDTIMNNIKFGNENVSGEDVIRVAKLARCHNFIVNMPDKYETVVGEGGGTLSGGEKQRISIARAMLKDAPIVILDESTSSIDPDNEKHIQEAIDELVKDKTLIIIAHKLSSIINSDEILVLEEGRIVERGKHDELILLDGKYSKMWNKHINAKLWKMEI